MVEGGGVVVEEDGGVKVEDAGGVIVDEEGGVMVEEDVESGSEVEEAGEDEEGSATVVVFVDEN